MDTLVAPPERVSERIQWQTMEVMDPLIAMPVSTLGPQPANIEQLVLDVPVLQMLDENSMLAALIEQYQLTDHEPPGQQAHGLRGHGELDPLQTPPDRV